MRRGRVPLGFELAKTVIGAVAVLALVIGVLQFDRLEKRLIQNYSVLKKVIERSNRTNGRLEKLSRKMEDLKGRPLGAGTDPSSGDKDRRRWLHPEVDNYLEPDPFNMVSEDAVPGGTLTRWFGSGPKGLNPLTENGADVHNYVNAYVIETFAEYHYLNPKKWKPVLATRIEITDDYKEYTIYLREGVMWHKPAVDLSSSKYRWLRGEHELTAKDVKFTADLILNPQVEAPFLRNYYKDLESCEIVDKHTVIFRWKKKTYNSLPFTLSFYPIPRFLYAYNENGEPFTEETLGLDFNNHWYNFKSIGTGPYKFVSYEQGTSIKLTRNEDYWGPKPPIKNITWLIFTDRKTNLLKFKSKELDYAHLYPSDYREEILKASPRSPFTGDEITWRFFDQTVYYYIGWNLEKPLFKDKRVRRALTMCLKRKQLIETVFQGLGTVVTGPFYHKSPYYDHKIKPLPYDLETAQKLLSEAGWADTDNDGLLDKVIDGKKVPFEFTFLLYSGSSEWRAVAAVFKESLMKVGIKLTVTEVEWSLMQKRMNDRDFDCYSGGWGLSWSPDPYQIWHSSEADIPKSSNRIGFKNKQADKIIEKLRETFETEERIKLCHEFHRLLHELQPYTFFYARKRVAAWWDHVERVIFRPCRPQTVSLPWYLSQNVNSGS